MGTRETYKPNGMTALLDAIGCTLEAYGEEMFNTLVILTDGEENSSKLYTNSQIKEVIEEKKWEVEYLGANQDAFSVGRSMGITQNLNFQQSVEGYNRMYSNMKVRVSQKRQSQERVMASYNR